MKAKMSMNPIFESAARRRMRTAKTPVIVTAYLASLLASALSQLTRFFGEGVRVAAMRQGVECYIWMTALQFLLIALVAPALSAGSIAGERERQTFDLLLVTGVGVRRIVLGKLLESFSFLALLILSGAPVLALVLVTGGVSALGVATTLAALLLIALAALAVGRVASTVFSRSLTAIIASYLAIFLIGAGTWALAKRGPLAAAYTYQSLQALAQRPDAALLSLPVTIFFNPAIALVTLLASQTGILHRTMRETLRLQDIYSAFTIAGYGRFALTALTAIALTALALIALAIAILHARTGAARASRGANKD